MNKEIGATVAQNSEDKTCTWILDRGWIETDCGAIFEAGTATGQTIECPICGRKVDLIDTDTED